MTPAAPSTFVRLVGIAIAGLLGALGGWSFVLALEWNGLGGALVAVLIAMTLATGLFAAWVTVLRALSRR
jgi:hypothetical protein